MNNILKTVADWKQLLASSVINDVHDIVRVQYSDVRRALYGHGNFVLTPAFSSHTVPYNELCCVLSETNMATTHFPS